VNVQLCVFASQASLVHALPSSHCASLVQQSAIGVLEQLWVPGSQLSVVHAFPSLHCALLVQQLAIGA
jgi:hypothetical protein